MLRADNIDDDFGQNHRSSSTLNGWVRVTSYHRNEGLTRPGGKILKVPDYSAGTDPPWEENPVFYQSLRERLEDIIERRRQEQVDDAQQLSLLNHLREEMKGEQTRARDIGLDARSYAIYGLLEQKRPMTVREKPAAYNVANRDLASRIDGAVTPFTDLIDWQQKQDLQREMRREIKQQLRDSGTADEVVESLTTDIVNLAKARGDR